MIVNGSHRCGYLDTAAVASLVDSWQRHATCVRARPGDASVLLGNTVHYAGYNESPDRPRRSMALFYRTQAAARGPLRRLPSARLCEALAVLHVSHGAGSEPDVEAESQQIIHARQELWRTKHPSLWAALGPEAGATAHTLLRNGSCPAPAEEGVDTLPSRVAETRRVAAEPTTLAYARFRDSSTPDERLQTCGRAHPVLLNRKK